MKQAPNSTVPTAKEAARDYQANLEAAFRAAGDANARYAKQLQQKLRKKRKTGNKYAGTIVKPHTFSSYGISSSASKRAAEQAMQEMQTMQEMHPASVNPSSDGAHGNNGGFIEGASSFSSSAMPSRKRRSKKKSSYDLSRDRLLKKEPSLKTKTTVLNPGAGGAPSSSNTNDATEARPNFNQHLTDVLVTLCKVEKAEGNLLPASSYERAALSLSRYSSKIMNANDLSSVRGIDHCAQSKIEEILHAEMRKTLGGGKDVMVHANELINAMKKKSKNKQETRSMKEAKLKLVSLLEEEQEREREREAFWRESGTQERSEVEKNELLVIFEQERTEASNHILLLLPLVVGKKKTINMITNMREDQQGAPRQGRQGQRAYTPTFVDSGWLGGNDGGGSVLPESTSSAEDDEDDDDDDDVEGTPTNHNSIVLPILHNTSTTSTTSTFTTSTTTTEKHLPSLLPFARHVLDTEDEHRSRQAMPLYKRNQPKIDARYGEHQAHQEHQEQDRRRRRTRVLQYGEEENEGDYGDYENYENYEEHGGREYDHNDHNDHNDHGNHDQSVTTTMNSRQIRYLKERATRKIARDAQSQRQKNQMRKRPKQLPVTTKNGEVMMLNVLDDGWQNNNPPKIVPNMKAKEGNCLPLLLWCVIFFDVFDACACVVQMPLTTLRCFSCIAVLFTKSCEP